MEGFARGRFGVRRTFQTDQVVLGLSVFDNVAVGGDASGDSPDQARTLMEIVDLSVDDGRSAASLTTLERRKVEFARALMGSPRVVLMDEPGAGLSSEEKAELERAIHSASDQLNTPVVPRGTRHRSRESGVLGVCSAELRNPDRAKGQRPMSSPGRS